MDQQASRPEFDPFSDHFFRQTSLAPVEIEAHDWDHPTPALSAGARRAMHATLGMLGASLTAVGGFLFYTHVLMPTPVELGAGGAVALPSMAPNALVAPQHVALAQAAAPAPATEAMPQPQLPHVQPMPRRVVAVAKPVVAAPVAHARTTVTRAKAQPAATHAAATPEDALVKQAFRALNSGNAHDALASARRALNTAPARADAWLVVGSAYAAMQDRASAQQAFRTCTLRATGPFVSECRKLARD